MKKLRYFSKNRTSKSLDNELNRPAHENILIIILYTKAICFIWHINIAKVKLFLMTRRHSEHGTRNRMKDLN